MIFKLQAGRMIGLENDKGGRIAHVIVGPSHGWAELRDVTTLDGRSGLIAAKMNGGWWWVKPLALDEDSE